MNPFQLLIVNFHYFREDKYASGIYPVSKKSFLNQLSILSKSFTFCSEQEIVDWINLQKFPSGKYCLLTFDDGLAEQMQAFEVLLKKGIPAVFYVPAAPYMSNVTLPVHKLHYVRSIMSDEKLYGYLETNPLFNSYPFPESLLNTQYRYDNDKAKRIKYFLNFVLTQSQADEVIGGIFSECVLDEDTFRKQLYMSEDHLELLASYQMLGSHGKDHRPLASLTAEASKNDIVESLRFFKRYGKFDIRSFSYPYGSRVAVNNEVAKQVAETSVQFALTMFRGVNSEEDLRSRFLLKRLDTNDAPGGKSPLKDLI